LWFILFFSTQRKGCFVGRERTHKPNICCGGGGGGGGDSVKSINKGA